MKHQPCVDLAGAVDVVLDAAGKSEKLKSVFTNFGVERASMDSEALGGTDDISAFGLKGLHNEMLLYLLEGKVIEGGHGSSGLMRRAFEFEPGVVDDSVVTEQDCAFKHVS